MLYLIGIGLKPAHLTAEAKDVMEKCDALYLDAYTSTYAEGNIEELEKLIGKKIFHLQRIQVEKQSKEIIATAKKNDVGFLVYGNVFSATTHVQLLLDAKKEGVKTSFFPGISVFNFLGSTGLDEYRFGRVCTIAYPEGDYEPESFMDIILQNQKARLHTLCLLDIKADENRLMNAKEGIEILEKITQKKGSKDLEKVVLIGMGAVGSEGEEIAIGRSKDIEKFNMEVFPQLLIVCGELTDKEREALEELQGWKNG